MFRIIPLGKTLETSHGPLKEYLASLSSENFTRTKIGLGSINMEDLTQRSSWTCDTSLTISVNDYLEGKQIPISEDTEFTLLKYELGDFFKLHRDSKGTHTCLIYGGSEYKGGTLTLQNKLTDIQVHPQKISEGYVMILFSIDFLHEVAPILEGTRYVLKTSIQLEEEKEEEKEEEEIELGGYLDCCPDGDY